MLQFSVDIEILGDCINFSPESLIVAFHGQLKAQLGVTLFKEEGQVIRMLNFHLVLAENPDLELVSDGLLQLEFAQN